MPESRPAHYFTWNEVADKRTGLVRIWPGFWKHMQSLDTLREWWGAPLIVTSGYRTPESNAATGGAGDSQHLLFTGPAGHPGQELRFGTDVVPSTDSPRLAHVNTDRDKRAVELLAKKAKELGFKGIIMYNWGLHLDMSRAEPYLADKR